MASFTTAAMPSQSSTLSTARLFGGSLNCNDVCRQTLPMHRATQRFPSIRVEASQAVTPKDDTQNSVLPRRQVLLPVVATALVGSFPAGLALADPVAADAPAAAAQQPAFAAYEDTTEQFSMLVPSEWSKGEGKVGTRKLLAFHPEETTQTNVSVLITPLGADFTGLGSFGTVDMFAEALVNGLDRSYLRKPGQEARLVSAKSARDVYYVEYTLRKPGEDKVHLLSAVAVNFNGIYNQLYTVTAQYLEDEAGAYDSTVRKVVMSFAIKK